jgi:hypothetical protein
MHLINLEFPNKKVNVIWNSTKASSVHVSSILTYHLYYISPILMSRTLFLVHKNGSFVFSRVTQQGGIQDDDVFFNWTIQDLMIMLSSGFPFRVGHKIHLDTFQLLLPTLSSPKSLVVDINASTSFFQFPLHSTLFNFMFFSPLLHLFHFVLQISLRGSPLNM